MIGFIVGAVVGFCGGFLLLALCVAARHGDAHVAASAGLPRYEAEVKALLATVWVLRRRLHDAGEACMLDITVQALFARARDVERWFR